MRGFRIVGVLLVAVLLAACSDPNDEGGGRSAEALAMAAHKESVRVMFARGWSDGDVDVFREHIAETVMFHYAGSPRTVSREAMTGMVLRWREVFPDLSVTIEEIIAERDLVATRLRLVGTHQGSWQGEAPTGEPVSMALMMFFRFEAGRMVEVWEADDQPGLREQMGL